MYQKHFGLKNQIIPNKLDKIVNILLKINFFVSNRKFKSQNNNQLMKNLKIIIVLSLLLLLVVISQSRQISSGKTRSPKIPKSSSTISKKSSKISQKNKNSSKESQNWLMSKLIGPMLFLLSFPIIWLNELKAVVEARRLKLAKSICVDIDLRSDQKIDKSLDGKLAYMTGKAQTDQILNDNFGDVGGQNLVRIERRVEVLQWRKKSRKLKNQNKTQIYYKLEWVRSNSEKEGEKQNRPQNWIIASHITFNESVYLGQFRLNEQIISKFSKVRPYTLEAKNVSSVQNICIKNERVASTDGNYLYLKSNQSAQGNNQLGLAPGSIRVNYNLFQIGNISVIAKAIIHNNQKSLSSFDISEIEGTKTRNIQSPQDGAVKEMVNGVSQALKPSENILIFEQKTLSKEQLFDEQASHLFIETMVLRLVSFVMMLMGVYLGLTMLTSIVGYIPLVGSSLFGFVMIANAIGSFIICIPLYLIALSISWIRFNPAKSVPVMLIGGMIIFYFWSLRGHKSSGDFL